MGMRTQYASIALNGACTPVSGNRFDKTAEGMVVVDFGKDPFYTNLDHNAPIVVQAGKGSQLFSAGSGTGLAYKPEIHG